MCRTLGDHRIASEGAILEMNAPRTWSDSRAAKAPVSRLACAAAPLGTLLPTFVEQQAANHDYWSFDNYYALDGECIERILVPAAEELWEICLHFVSVAVVNEQILSSLGIPSVAWDAVRASWERADPPLFARFDLSFDGRSPPKLHETNIDVVGMFYETAVFQKDWLQYQKDNSLIDASVRQFANLEDATARVLAKMIGKSAVEISSLGDDPYDDLLNSSIYRIISRIGIDCQIHNYTSPKEFMQSIGGVAACLATPHIIKSFRWNHVMHDELLSMLGERGSKIASPLWSLVLSSKGSLAWLWQFNRGHPNLLATFFEPAPLAESRGFVSKPLLSIQGQGIMLCDRRAPGRSMVTSGSAISPERVFQDLHYLPRFGADGGGPWASTGAWIVEGKAVAVGMADCDCPIITDPAMRYVPHVLT